MIAKVQKHHTSDPAVRNLEARRCASETKSISSEGRFRPILLKNSISARHRTRIEKWTLQIGARSTISSRARGEALSRT